jgi:AhpD family alkylhydroperoxidase
MEEMAMHARTSYAKSAPDVLQSMLALSGAVRKSGLPEQLLALIEYRVSQMNGCAFCLDMHSKDLRALGETEQRIYIVSAWREVAHLYSARERAALAWAEAVTSLAHQDVPDPVYAEARKEFSDQELAELTLGVVAINGWNRLNIAFRTPAGDYQSQLRRPAA